jgi:hypothetical protein
MRKVPPGFSWNLANISLKNSVSQSYWDRTYKQQLPPSPPCNASGISKGDKAMISLYNDLGTLARRTKGKD